MTTAERRDIRRILTEHPWTPGTFGKGVVTRAGNVYTWDADALLTDTESTYGGADVHHTDVMTALGMVGSRWAADGGAFYINEAGTPDFDGVPTRLRPKVEAYLAQRQ